MKVVIFSVPERKEMLASLLNELKGLDVTVINSPETYGKEKFWMRMKQAWELCLGSTHDNYLILPDDVFAVDLDRIKKIHQKFTNAKYSVNVINDGRRTCWFGKPRPFKNEGDLIHTDYCDCGFLSNRKSMGLIDIEEVPPEWFNRPNKSSGVGHQITRKFRQQHVTMYTPKTSLVYHGEHDSVMNFEERKRIKLISR
jgi:hypothetical protein